LSKLELAYPPLFFLLDFLNNYLIFVHRYVSKRKLLTTATKSKLNRHTLNGDPLCIVALDFYMDQYCLKVLFDNRIAFSSDVRRF